ncbi:alpha/beta hydrolase fold domain-containing protein [Agromyces sp. SYSU T00194]|uniref:alpha/beta hydrolase fold domain-containing protein n=1 Tax=Agromyces chitinivorans TaxID=3158560 RepID=UPI00339A59C0
MSIAHLLRVYEATDAAGETRPEHESPARADRTLLVWAHGGGFAFGDLDMPEADWVASRFADRGIPVVSVDYRLAHPDRPGSTFPAASDDVLVAWRWAVANAANLGADRIAIGGASAGANIVTGAVLRMLAAATGGLRERMPDAVFLAYPTLHAVQPAPAADLRAALDANPDADRFGPDAVRAMYERYLGGPVEGAPVAAVPGTAPRSALVGFPATLIVNDEVDELRVSGEAFAAMLADAGTDVTCETEPGTDHGHLNRPDQPAAARTVARVADWIDDLAASAHRATADAATEASAPDATTTHDQTPTTPITARPPADPPAAGDHPTPTLT